MKIFKFCTPYLKLEKKKIILYIFLAIVSAIIGILSPYILGNFVDYLVKGGDRQIIFKFCIIYSGLNLFRIIKDFVSSILYTKIQIKIGYNLNIFIIQHIQKLSILFLSKKEEAYLNQRINGDSYNLITFCIETLENVFVNIIFLIVPVIMLYNMNKFITIIMLGYISLYVMVYLLLKEKIYIAGFKFKEGQAKFFSRLFEQFKYIKLIKLNSIREEINNRLFREFSKFFETAVQCQKTNFLYNSLDSIISIIAQITLFIIGGFHVLNGSFTIGMFTIFSSYFNMILNASSYFFSLGSSYQDSISSYNRIKEILDVDVETNGNIKLSNIEKISLKNVTFSYNLHDSYNIIQSFSYEFCKGNIYSIMGSNGVGKSTLINLLLGIYIDEHKGIISYNNINIQNIDMISARKDLIGIAEQEPTLINDSILYNIIFNNSTSEDNKKKIYQYSKILNIEEFMRTRTLDFYLDEKNTNLSGGEKQKLAILKVMLKNPEVIIFDEPTSALDTNTSIKFIDYLKSIKKDKIIINITHDNALAKQSDFIINLNGNLNEEKK